MQKHPSCQKLLITLLLACISLIFTNTAFSQKLIRGKVTSDSIHIIAGVTVKVQGSTVQTTTDNQGQYSISAGDNEILVFSMDGYIPQEVFVNGRSVIDVILQKSSGLNGRFADNKENDRNKN